MKSPINPVAAAAIYVHLKRGTKRTPKTDFFLMAPKVIYN